MIRRLEFEKIVWRKINYRSGDNILTAEFIHDLYNRHNPNINSIRFRNTIVLFKNNEIISFAPQKEWDQISKWFGRRFRLRENPLFKELDLFIEKGHKRTLSLENKLKRLNFEKINNEELLLLFLDLHYIPLGDIYEINLVQIEHALFHAFKEELNEINPNKNNQVIASNLLINHKNTFAAKEELDFFKIVKWGLRNIERKRFNVNQNVQIKEMINSHFNKWGLSQNAYGASTINIKQLTKRFNYYFNIGEDFINNKIHKIVNKNNYQYSKILENSYTLKRNCNYLIKVGDLRDMNKALLGRIVKWREVFYREICKRAKVNVHNLRYYLLNEICELIDNKKNKLPHKVIQIRKKGVVFIRQEVMDINYNDYYKNTINFDVEEKNNEKILIGICASKGKYKGKAVIVKNIIDSNNVNEGDIIVAPGTDFNILNAMQKAGAIVTEEGGILSHAAVIAREYQIPCIVGVDKCTTIIKTGDNIIVDSLKGIIEIC